MLGRRDKTPAASSAPVVLTKPSGKGRPTPKRSEAQLQRRKQVTAPRTRREAYQRLREESKRDRMARRQGLVTGDARALPARDQGPVRAFVRDFVDSRRTLAEFFLFLAVIVLVLSFGVWPDPVQVAGFYAWLVLLPLMVLDTLRLSRSLRKALAERFPNENRKGAVSYGLMRSTQLRLLRLPKPRVKPGMSI